MEKELVVWSRVSLKVGGGREERRTEAAAAARGAAIVLCGEVGGEFEMG